MADALDDGEIDYEFKNEDAVEADAEIVEDPQSKANEGGRKKRYIVFVGNLAYHAKKDHVQKHFEKGLGKGKVISVRILEDKNTKKSKGFAFVELADKESHLGALDMHQSFLHHRKINVEMTAGGGGNTAKRKEKLKQKNDWLDKRRVRKIQEKLVKIPAGKDKLAHLAARKDD